MGNVDGNATRLLFWGIINTLKRTKIAKAAQSRNFS